MLKRILVGLARQEQAEVEISHAIELAKIHEAVVTALTVVDIPRLTHVGPTPIGGGGAAEELRQHRVSQAKERIAEVSELFTSRCSEAGVRFEIQQAEGDPHNALLEHISFQDLSIFALHSLFDYGVITDSGDAIDLLIGLITAGVRPILAIDENYRKVEKVLIAYSGSVRSARALKQFIRFNPWPGMGLRIVSFGKDSHEGEHRLAQAADYCQEYGLNVETKFIEGPAKGRIIEAADDFGADAIVMGNSAKNLLLKKIFGETALHCLKHADRPVFLNQ